MTVTEQMITRSAHYTGLLGAMDSRGATKLRREERELLLAAADALLFDEVTAAVALDAALRLIRHLEDCDRWSASGAAELRHHVLGCGRAAASRAG